MNVQPKPSSQWPKTLAPLTTEQMRIRDDFMHYWHEVLPKRFGMIERFNHRFPVQAAPSWQGCRTLEIGAGLGEHLAYENLVHQTYHCVELRSDMASRISERFPSVVAKVGDCQERLDYPDQSFDRVVAVHVLEHLPNLPAALAELRRLLTPEGNLVVVIPCDPGFAYGLARRISAQRLFERRYNQSYDWFIRSEHINTPSEIIAELERDFRVIKRRFFPLFIPLVSLNLCQGLVLKRRHGLIDT